MLGDLRSKQTICLLNGMIDVIVLPSVRQREYCEAHFMQDEAPTHSVFAVQAWLDSHFTCRWIGRGKPSDWTPRSVGLNPCNLFCVAVPGRRSTDQNQNTRRTGTSSKYVGNSKINLRLVGKKKRVVIAPKRTLSSNK